MRLYKEGRLNPLIEIEKRPVWALVFSAILIALGVMLFIAPLASVGVLIWAMFALMAIACIIGIVRFIVPPKGERRDGAMLALAIIMLLLLVGILISAILHKPVKVDGQEIAGFTFVTTKLVQFFSVFFGFVSIITSIVTLFGIGQVNEGKGWVIAGAVVSIILGVLMIIFPFILTVVGAIICAVYFIAIALGTIIYAIKVLANSKKIKE